MIKRTLLAFSVSTTFNISETEYSKVSGFTGTGTVSELQNLAGYSLKVGYGIAVFPVTIRQKELINSAAPLPTTM